MVVVLTVKFFVMPNIERYQGDIVSRVAATTGMDVSAQAIRGGWSGFRPFIELESVVLRETADSTIRTPGEEALRLPELRAALSWWSLLVGQVRFADVRVMAPEIALVREADGLIYFAGRPLNAPTPDSGDTGFVETLLAQPGVSIHHATLIWEDRLAGQTLRLSDVGISVDKRLHGHVVGLTALPPPTLARKVELRGTLDLTRLDGRWRIGGQLYAEATDANWRELTRFVKLSDILQTGVGNVRAWVSLDNAAAFATPAPTNPVNPLAAATVDLHLINTRAQLAEGLAPLELAKLAGRMEYRQLDGGFSVASKGLELRTRDGVTLAPADFSVALTHQDTPANATGEVSANGLELKVLTALLEYFPIGRDLRAQVSRFSPRGEVRDFTLAWTGWLDKPASYRIKGRLANFGSLAHEAVPGIAGLTGSIEGNEQGGRFTLASKDFALDVPRLFRAPLAFAALEGSGSWKVDADQVVVEVSKLKLENEDLAGEIGGRYWRYRAGGKRAAEEKGPGSLDMKATFDRVKATGVANYLPNGIAQSREYVEWAVRAGELADTEMVIKGSIYDFPYRGGEGGRFRIASKVKGVEYRYLEGWPVVTAAEGEVVFENTAFKATVESARIFNAPLKNVALAIDDFGADKPVFTLQGTADARAEEASRFLKESPLIDGVGGFTRFVALDGPGRLELGLRIPMGAADPKKDPLKVTGRYTIARGHARLALGDKGTDVNGIAGSVAFTEASVRSTGLTGTAFGHPVSVAIAGGGDAGIAVDFTARADVSQVNDILPFRMPRQVAGVTDFTGRMTAKGGVTDVTVTSTLAGVRSTLPPPLAMAANESRKLTVRFSNLGVPAERISVQVAGAGNDEPASRLDGRFQRRFDSRGNAQGLAGGVMSIGEPAGEGALPEGLWIMGSLPRLDFDAWREAFDTFYPPAAGAAAGGAAEPSPVAGFDFRLGGLVAYGRPFKAMTLKGRQGGDGWRMTVESEEASGQFSWRPAAYNDLGMVRARLENFVLVDEAPAAAAPAPAPGAPDPELPALDIVAEKFTFKNTMLGKLELSATPQGPNWRIERLNITNGHARLEMNGLWQRAGNADSGGKSVTTMGIKLDTSNLNALFNQFGYGDYLKGGRAKLDGVLSWPGHANQFNTSTLSGNLKVEARDGRFAKIEPGAGKLLGLLSLQSITRRITFDFRDVFSEGLAFDRIDGDVEVKNGIMNTGNFTIKGPSAEILMTGEISLPAERQNVVFTIEPKIGEGAAIGVGVLATPLAGAGAYLLSKLLEGALTYQMSATGTWDNPHVERIRQPPRTAAAGQNAGEPRKTP